LDSTWEVENHKWATELAEELFHKRKVGRREKDQNTTNKHPFT
jgi:hypothetical protein